MVIFFFIRCMISIRFMFSVKQISVVRVKVLNRLVENLVVCLVCVSSFIRLISDVIEEFLKMLRNFEVSGGMMIWKVCGSSMWWQICGRWKFIVWVVEVCLQGSVWMLVCICLQICVVVNRLRQMIMLRQVEVVGLRFCLNQVCRFLGSRLGIRKYQMNSCISSGMLWKIFMQVVVIFDIR